MATVSNIWLFLFGVCLKGKWSEVKSLSHARLFATPWIVACTKLPHPWDFQGKSTGVSCYFLLQGIFPAQGSNPGLSHCRQTLYHLSHQGRAWRGKRTNLKKKCLKHFKVFLSKATHLEYMWKMSTSSY